MRSERGYVEMRLLVVLALAAALVWVLPFLLFGDRDSEPEPAATTAPIGVTAEDTLPDVAAPPVDGPAPTGAGAAGAVPTGPVATGPGNVLQPAEQAYDLQAQSTLNDAVRVAQVYDAENGSFQGYGPDVAVDYDPSIVYSHGAPIANMVSMTVTPTTVVLVTIADGLDGAGGYLCAAIDQDVVTFGRANATMPSQCQGGW
jgi:hypothetical protein